MFTKAELKHLSDAITTRLLGMARLPEYTGEAAEAFLAGICEWARGWAVRGRYRFTPEEIRAAAEAAVKAWTELPAPAPAASPAAPTTVIQASRESLEAAGGALKSHLDSQAKQVEELHIKLDKVLATLESLQARALEARAERANGGN